MKCRAVSCGANQDQSLDPSRTSSGHKAKPDPSASASAEMGPAAEPAPTSLGMSVLCGLLKSLGDHLRPDAWEGIHALSSDLQNGA